MDWGYWFYQSPTWLSCIAFVLLIVVISLIGAMLYTWSGLSCFQCDGGSGNNTVSIFLSMMALFLGVTVGLLITQANVNYNDALASAALEANNIYTLYVLTGALENGQSLQRQVDSYLDYIIDVEYPALKIGELPELGYELIDGLVRNIVDYGPQATTGPQQTIWANAMNTVTAIQQGRITRLSEAAYGVNNVLFWVTVAEATILLVLSWVINCDNWFRFVYVALVAVYVGASLYIMITLPYPFLGYNAITPLPFEQVRSIINGGGGVITTIPFCGRPNK